MRLTCVWRAWLWGVLLVVGLSQQQSQARHLPYVPCESEQQQVMCGTIPFRAVGERIVCCQLYRPDSISVVTEAGVAPVAPAAAGGVDSSTGVGTAAPAPVAAGSTAPNIAQSSGPLPDRSDLYSLDGASTSSNMSDSSFMNDRQAFPRTCTTFVHAHVPVFTNSTATTEEMNAAFQLVPELRTDMIQSIKNHTLQSLQTSQDSDLQSLLQRYSSISSSSGGFKHPGGYAGAAELAFMQQQLSANAEPQTTAMRSLISGEGVPVKTFGSGSTWALPRGCPAIDYEGTCDPTSLHAEATILELSYQQQA